MTVPNLGPGLSEPPTEDRGHETARWYAYQYACTARECFAMLVRSTPWVLCEWHTDYVRAGSDDSRPHVLVSVKHRGPDQGAWPLAELPAKGGFKVLYARWLASQRTNTCQWVTNGGFKVGEGQTRGLAKVLAQKPGEREDGALDRYARSLQESIGAETFEDALAFLSALEMISTGGDEFSMRSLVIEDTARPTLERVGVPPGMARAAYQAAFDLVFEAVLGLDPHEPDVDWMVGRDALDHSKGVRMITRARFIAKLRQCGIPISDDLGAAGNASATLMTKKLRAGSLGPTVISSAPRLRRRWYEVEVSFRPDVPNPMADEVGRIRAEVLHRAGIAEMRTRGPGNSYGPAMHRELVELLADPLIQPRIPVGGPELVGCAFQLTDECEVWWSDIFDISGEAPWVNYLQSTKHGDAKPIASESPESSDG
jgi:hypothetical protein